MLITQHDESFILFCFEEKIRLVVNKVLLYSLTYTYYHGNSPTFTKELKNTVELRLMGCGPNIIIIISSSHLHGPRF